MRRSSVYYPLRYIVQCQPAGQAFFENIAAFNDDGVAIDYACDCLKGKPIGWKYRVVHHQNNEDRTIYRSDASGVANVARA